MGKCWMTTTTPNQAIAITTRGARPPQRQRWCRQAKATPTLNCTYCLAVVFLVVTTIVMKSNHSADVSASAGLLPVAAAFSTPSATRTTTWRRSPPTPPPQQSHLSSPTMALFDTARDNDKDMSFSSASLSDDSALSTSTLNETTTASIVLEDIAKKELETTNPVAAAPSYQQLLLFGGTTVLIWLSEPLLSLVDTTVVGLTQGKNAVTQLASLGPATTLLDSLLYLTYFLAIATTNQIAAGRALGDVRQLQRTTSQTLGVAAVLGTAVTAAVWLCGHGWLTSMAGASAATPGLVNYANSYARLRAIAAIPAVVGMTAQSVCLATLDTTTPALAVLIASVLNVVGDVALAPALGVRGAALATAASNVASTAVLLRAVRRQLQKWRQQEQAEDHKVYGTDAATTTPAIPMFSLPDRTALMALLKLVGPIFFVICAKIVCYSAMTLRCTNFGVLPLAAHGIMMRLWFFFGCFGDSLSQTAQSFLPSTLYPKPRPKEFRQTLRRMLWIALGLGLTNSQMSTAILKYGGSLFTKDAAILEIMKAQTSFIGLSLILHPFIMCLEGTVIAARDFSTLVATYAVTLGVHFSILKYFCPSFPAVWRTFFFFQSIRFINFSSHVWKKQKRSSEENSVVSAAAAVPAS